MTGRPDPAPLVVTAALPPDLHRWATRLRAAHYPPERNFLEAHVTLFRTLAPGYEAEVRDTLAAAAREYAPPRARLEGVMSLGGGTALRLSAPAMLALREQLAESFHGLLTAQDQHPPRLHVTIQNKVSLAEARALQAEIEAVLELRGFAFPALALYRYCGGLWEHARDYAFRGRAQI